MKLHELRGLLARGEGISKAEQPPKVKPTVDSKRCLILGIDHARESSTVVLTEKRQDGTIVVLDEFVSARPRSISDSEMTQRMFDRARARIEAIGLEGAEISISVDPSRRDSGELVATGTPLRHGKSLFSKFLRGMPTTGFKPGELAVGGLGLRGRRADVVIVDDPYLDKAISDESRESVKKWFEMTVAKPRLDGGLAGAKSAVDGIAALAKSLLEMFKAISDPKPKPSKFTKVVSFGIVAFLPWPSVILPMVRVFDARAPP